MQRLFISKKKIILGFLHTYLYKSHIFFSIYVNIPRLTSAFLQLSSSRTASDEMLLGRRPAVGVGQHPGALLPHNGPRQRSHTFP